VTEFKLPQRYIITADISHCEALNRDWEIKFPYPAAHRLPRCRYYLT